MTDPISNFIKSKILGLASLLLLIASMATITAVFLPFWFSLHMHLQFVEDEKPQQTFIDRSINCGLFFLDENRFVNTIMLDKADNTHFMPALLRVAQLLYLLGSIGTVLCCGSAFILAFRQYATPSGEMFLAAGATGFSLSQVISCILILLHMAFFSYQPWQNFPVADYIPLRFTYYTILEAHPDMSLNFGFFIGAGAALFSLVAAVMLWIQACCTYCHLRNVRYNMLREKPDLGSSPLPTKGSYFNPAFVRTSPQEYPAVVQAAPTPQFAPYAPPTQYTAGMELDLWSFVSSTVKYLGTIVSFYSWLVML